MVGSYECFPPSKYILICLSERSAGPTSSPIRFLRHIRMVNNWQGHGGKYSYDPTKSYLHADSRHKPWHINGASKKLQCHWGKLKWLSWKLLSPVRYGFDLPGSRPKCKPAGGPPPRPGRHPSGRLQPPLPSSPHPHPPLPPRTPLPPLRPLALGGRRAAAPGRRTACRHGARRASHTEPPLAPRTVSTRQATVTQYPSRPAYL